MDKSAKIYVAGHKGLVGSALVRELHKQGYVNIVTRSREEVDLKSQLSVDKFFEEEKPEYVFLAAARVGGILANNTYPADFIRENLLIETHVIDSAYRNGVKKLLFLGSSCVYPKFAEQPIKETSFLDGELEATNKAYAVAKIAGIVMCQSYLAQYGFNTVSVMPTNLYGEGDNFDLATSHVLPAMIRKFHEAKENNSPEITLWGTGKPRREFLYVDDLAEACVLLMNDPALKPDIINIGTGEDLSIKELAELVKDCVGYEGKIEWDQTKPDGTPQKLLDVSKIFNLTGWKYKTNLKEGIKKTYEWYKQENK